MIRYDPRRTDMREMLNPTSRGEARLGSSVARLQTDVFPGCKPQRVDRPCIAEAAAVGGPIALVEERILLRSIFRS